VDPPPLAQFLAETLDLAGRLVPSEAGSLLLDHPNRARKRSPLTFVAAFGRTADRLIGVTMPSGQGIVGHVYRSGETYATGNPTQDEHFFAGVDALSEFQTRSVVAAPIRLESAVCGVFELVNRRGRPFFSERDVELVELLSQYVSRAILNAVDILKQNEWALWDALTGVRNIRGMEEFLDQEITVAHKMGTDICVLFVDVDRLKSVNDLFGHRAGSEVLRCIGKAMTEALENRGFPFRFGGDEFVAVCPGASIEAGEVIANEIRHHVLKTQGSGRGGSNLPAVSVSVGVASLRDSLGGGELPGDPASKPSARLLSAADHALYRAKRTGRDRTVRATARDDTLRMKIEVEGGS